MKTILLVEDDIDLSSNIKYMLNKSGHTVFVAHDGAEGIAIAKERVPDVIIMDYLLSGVMGGEAVSTIKKHPPCKNITVIFLTGLMKNRDIKDGVNTIIVDGKSYPVLAKPFEFSHLLKIIDNVT